MSDHEYSVGYKKPPRAHAFKQGQSGNQAGRPKRVKQGIVEKTWSQLVPHIGANGRARPVTLRRLEVELKFAAALKGDLDAIEGLFAIRRTEVAKRPLVRRAPQVVIQKELPPEK